MSRTNAFKSPCLFYFALCLCAALFLPTSTSAEAAHRSPWSQWGPVNDAHLNAIDFSIRKGDNNFVERGMIFVRIRNRYTQNASGEISFDLVNGGTGDVHSSTQGFDLKPGQVDENQGNWFILPGVKDGADAWSAAEGSVRNVQMKYLRLPDATGKMTQAYPVDEIAVQGQKAAEAVAKKHAEEQRQQAEAAATKQQADQQAATRQADRERQAQADREKAATDRRAAVQKREEDDQNRQQESARRIEEDRQTEARRKAQVVLDQANRTMQNMANVNQVDIAASAQTNQRQKDADTELARRREEIGSQSRSSVDPKMSQLLSDPQEPQDELATSQASVERQQVEVDRYKQLADADQNPMTSAVNRVGQTLAENDLRKYQDEAKQHQSEIKRIQRKIDNEKESWDREKETALNTALADAQSASEWTRTVTITQPEPHPPTVATPAQQAAVAAAIGRSLWEKNRWPEVEIAYREAIRLQPAEWAYSRNLGIALEQQNKWPGAETAFREAVRLKADSADDQGWLGLALSRQNKWAESEISFREAVRLSPNDAENQHNLGAALQSQEKWVDAQSAYRNAVSLKPDNKVYQSDLYTATQNVPQLSPPQLLLLGKQEDRAISLARSDVPSERARGQVLMNTLINQYPDNACDRWMLSESYMRDGKNEQAGKTMQNGLHFMPSDQFMQTDAHLVFKELGGVYLKKKQYTKSADFYHRAVSLKPNNIFSYGMLVIVYTRANMPKQAEEMRRGVAKHKAMNLLHPEPQGI